MKERNSPVQPMIHSCYCSPDTAEAPTDAALPHCRGGDGRSWWLHATCSFSGPFRPIPQTIMREQRGSHYTVKLWITREICRLARSSTVQNCRLCYTEVLRVEGIRFSPLCKFITTQKRGLLCYRKMLKKFLELSCAWLCSVSLYYFAHLYLNKSNHLPKSDFPYCSCDCYITFM